MNPVDHPHGGGEGKKPKPVVQKTPWGKRAKYVKTVVKKKNSKDTTNSKNKYKNIVIILIRFVLLLW